MGASIPGRKARLWWIAAGGTLLLVASVSPPVRLPIDPAAFGDAACAVEADACLSVPVAPPPPAPAAEKRPPRPAWIESGDGGLRILVSIPQQRLWLFRGSEFLAAAPVSTGKPGHETPVGRFHILQKAVHHRSNRYSNAPMPFMQRLTMSGVALHAGHLPGYPASHGCIRMPWGFAKKLFGLTDGATRVTVTRMRPKSAREAARLA